METVANINSALAQCYCSDQNYKNELLHFVYTSGVKTMWEMCGEHGAYWLLIAIASYRKKQPFQIWTLEVENSKAVLTMKEDTGQPVLVRQEIPYTDFPLDKMVLWLIDGVLILPSEY